MSFSADVQSFISNAAAKYGVSADYLTRTAQLESGGNVLATNPKSSAAGLFQFTRSTAAAYGLSNPLDGQASANAAAQLARDNGNYLTKFLGRAPDNAELYLAHQQGAGGALSLLRGGSAPAVSIVGMDEVMNNGGNEATTAADFVDLWRAKFDGSTAAASAADTATASDGGFRITAFDAVGEYFVRAVVVVLGIVLVALGVAMLRNGSDRTVLNARRPVVVVTRQRGKNAPAVDAPAVDAPELPAVDAPAPPAPAPEPLTRKSSAPDLTKARQFSARKFDTPSRSALGDAVRRGGHKNVGDAKEPTYRAASAMAKLAGKGANK